MSNIEPKGTDHVANTISCWLTLNMMNTRGTISFRFKSLFDNAIQHLNLMSLIYSDIFDNKKLNI